MYKVIIWLGGFLYLTCSASASTILVRASAEVISPADVSVQAVTQLLLSSTPGVYTLTIPGSGGLPDRVFQLSAAGEGVGGSLVSLAYTQSASAIARLVALVTQGAAFPNLHRTLSTDLASHGVLNGQGVQLAVLNTTQGAGNERALAAIITFD